MLNSTTTDQRLKFTDQSHWTTKAPGSLEWCSSSDHHLGHPKCPTEHIIANMDEMIPDNAQTAKLDIITLCGDLFDRLLTLPEDEVEKIRQWIRRLLWICQKYNIVLRVLEGTPSHDRGQSRIIQGVLDDTGYKVDYRYVTTLSIERITALGITVLYVPDEWRRDPLDTYNEVLELLREAGLERVDFAVMHGAFEYQLPEVARKNHPTHDSESWLALVEYVIFIGHIHQYSETQSPNHPSRIVSHGSFDRLTHGEEAPKGYIRATITPDSVTCTFIENQGALVFKTLDVAELNAAQVIEVIEKHTHFPNGSHLRLSALPGDPALAAIREIAKQYPQYHITPHRKKLKEESVAEAVRPARYVPRNISRDNMAELVTDWLKRRGHEQWQINHCRELLNEQLT